jgi:hypothetical protein
MEVHYKDGYVSEVKGGGVYGDTLREMMKLPKINHRSGCVRQIRQVFSEAVKNHRALEFTKTTKTTKTTKRDFDDLRALRALRGLIR